MLNKMIAFYFKLLIIHSFDFFITDII